VEIQNTAILSFLKSATFSVLLCLYCGSFAAIRACSLMEDFELSELLRLIYNVTMSLFFLIRVRPAVVSMNLIHWAVALITSFAGFLFFREGANSIPILLCAGDVLILIGTFLGIMATLILGRSMGLLPAVRDVRTKYLYRIVRHPMYLSIIIFKLGYVLKHPSIYNIVLLAAITALYDRRARYEEDVMSHDSSYVAYLRQVKYRLIPGIY
jgi:protein-S-isoprenylcysteine O-methyltransferase Ste14